MATRGVFSLSQASALALASLLALGACTAVDSRFGEVAPESVVVGERAFEVRIIDVGDKTYDVLTADTGKVISDPTQFQLQYIYTDDDPDRHALYVAASKKALESRCKDEQPFMQTYSPIPWEPFAGSFRCL